MKLTVLGNLLLDEGWQIVNNQLGHNLLMHRSMAGGIAYITPTASAERIPHGTLNAIIRGMHQKKSAVHWLSSLPTETTAPVILEKQGKLLWARLELPGLLVATRGCTVDCVLNQIRTLLLGFAGSSERSYRVAIESMVFQPVYDTSAVWELIKQLKTNHIADEAGMDLDLVGRFMTGASYPCVEQASRLESSIRELGRQLMQVSIH